MFAEKYGPWALVAGASDGVGAAFAEALAQRGLNVVLVARREAVLAQVADRIRSDHGVETRSLAIDLADDAAAQQIAEATADLQIGFLVYCAGADPDYAPFLDSPNTVAYGASKAFDMVFAEALWAELRHSGVDVIGPILGKTDTPALRDLEHRRGASTDSTPADAATVEDVVAEAFANLENGPTVLVGDVMKAAAPMLGSLTRRQAVELMTAAGTATMG